MAQQKKLTRAQQKALRPLQILDAAFEEFVINGFTATRVEDIADRVGVTKGTLYVYFQTKEHLFEEVMKHISVPFEEILPDLEALSGSAAEKLRTFLKLAYERVLEERKTREMMRFVIAEGHRFPLLVDRHHDQFIAPIVGKMEALLKEGVEAGEFRATPARFSEIVVAPLMAAMLSRLVFGDRRPKDREAYLEATFDLLLDGLNAKRR